MFTRIIMIRHGETDWNVQRRYMGTTDIALNARGIEQAHALAARIDRSGITGVYASDRSRASAFARIVFPGHAVIEDCAFREMDFGIFEGLTHDEIMARHQQAYTRWLDDPVRTPVQGGESFMDLVGRVRSAVTRIAQAHRHGSVAVVTHSGPIRVMLNDAPTKENFWGMRPDNGSVYAFEVTT